MQIGFNIEIADKVVGIKAIYESTYNFCHDYITTKNSDFQIEIDDSDIKYEQDKYENEVRLKGNDLFPYSNSYFETLAVYRKIATKLVNYDIILFHGSAIAVDGESYIFTAKSGVGKSTHTKLWCDYFGNKARIINDDKPLIKITDNGVVVYGTPWNGKHNLSNNISAPLKAIAILERDIVNHILPINKRTALPMLYQQTFRPSEARELSKVMSLIDKLADNVMLYKLNCNMELEAAKIAYFGMNEENLGEKK